MGYNEAPVWTDLDGELIVFMTSADSIKGKAIRRDGRVSLCWEEYGRRNAVPPEMVVTVTPTRVVATVDVSD
jgi:hypothetical protein